MQVTTVKYERLVNLGNFNNEKIGAEATVGDTESPDQVLSALQFMVAHSVVKRGLHDPQSELEVRRARAVLAGEHEERVAREVAAKAAREAQAREDKAAWERDASFALKSEEEGYIPF